MTLNNTPAFCSIIFLISILAAGFIMLVTGHPDNPIGAVLIITMGVTMIWLLCLMSFDVMLQIEFHYSMFRGDPPRLGPEVRELLLDVGVSGIGL